MKKLPKILLLLFAIVIIGIVGILSYVSLALPDVDLLLRLVLNPTLPLSKMVDTWPITWQFVLTVTVRDYTLFAAPPIAGTEGKGGETFDHRLGFLAAILPRISLLRVLEIGLMVKFTEL
jgi:hypothetical protein